MADASSIVSGVLQVILGAVAGFVGALVTFRTRLALNDLELAKSAARYDERFQRIERLQRVTLQQLADVARTVGADKRFSDALLRVLSEEPET